MILKTSCELLEGALNDVACVEEQERFVTELLCKMNIQLIQGEITDGVYGDMGEHFATELLWECLRGKILKSPRKSNCEIDNVRDAIANGAIVSDEMMIYAVEWNLDHIIPLLLEGGGSANIVPNEAFGSLGGGTLMSFAVVNGAIGAMKALLAGGALVDGHEEDSVTPLMWAGYYNDVECTGALLEAGACVNAVDILGRTALLLASSDGGRNVIEMLLNAGADPNMADTTGTTPLMASSRYGVRHWSTNEPRRLAAQLLLSRGANANAVDNHGNTALLRATEYNVRDMCAKDAERNVKEFNLQLKVLLEGGSLVNAVGMNRSTALINICRWRTFQGELSVQLLLDAGADLSHVDIIGNTALIVASACNTAKVVDTLITAGADVNMQNQIGQTALMRAAADNDIEVVQCLLSAGAQVDIEDLSGRTALIGTLKYADDCYVGRPSRREIAGLLLSFGANVNKADHDGDTVLHLTCNHYMEDMMNEAHGEEILLQLTEFIDGGADVNAVGSIGSTALMNVCRTQRHRSVDMVHLLLDHGADVNAVDDHGMTPLLTTAHWSCLYSDRVAAALLSRGADINMQDTYGRSVGELVDFTLEPAQELAIVLIRGGVLFSELELDMYEMPKDASVQCRGLKLHLQHLCREQIRCCIMTSWPGKRIEKLVAQLPLPQPMIEYVANVNRYDFDSESWKVD